MLQQPHREMLIRDMIYIGNDDSARNDLINGVSPMLYTHVGAAVNVNSIHDLSQDIKKLSLMASA